MEQPENIKEELLEMFHRSIHLLHRSGPHLRRHGRRATMPPAQGRLMKILAAVGPITQRNLGEILDMRSASVSELLGKLEKPGWITRSPNPNDKRTIDITLTKEGEKMLRSVGNERTEMAEEVFGNLSEEELRQLHGLLGKLIGDWENRFESEEGRSRFGRHGRGEGRPDRGPGLFQHVREHFQRHRHHHGPHDVHAHHDHYEGGEHHRGHEHHGHHFHPDHGERFDHHDHHQDRADFGPTSNCSEPGCDETGPENLSRPDPKRSDEN